jgi:iron(III) transport system ATP-binding protein
MEPRVLLFDEPLSNLDAKLRVQMRSEIRGLQRRLNITSVYVTHDQVEAMAMSDRIVVMNAGKIEQVGTPVEIYRFPVSRFVADFIGRANFIEACVESVSPNQVSLTLLGKTINVPASGSTLKHNDMVTVVLRPEALDLKADTSTAQAKIEQVMYLGSAIEYIVRIHDQPLIVVDNDPGTSRIFSEGQVVGVDFIDETVHILPLTRSS